MTRVLLFAVTGVVWVAGCTEFTGPTGDAQLEAAQARWESVGPTTYTLRLTRRGGLGTGDTWIWVREGVVDRVTDASGLPEAVFPGWTIDDAFAVLQSWGAERFEAEFDPSYGFPRRAKYVGPQIAIYVETRFEIVSLESGG